MKKPKAAVHVFRPKPAAAEITPAAFTVLVVGPAGTQRDECVASIKAAGLHTVAASGPKVTEYVKDLITQGVAK